MPQTHWIWNREQWPHDELMDYSSEYRVEFPYPPEMLHVMWQPEERTYISPTMLADCTRQAALKRLLPYGEYPDHAYARYRGTMGHVMLEEGQRKLRRDLGIEMDAILEQPLEVKIRFPGRTFLHRYWDSDINPATGSQTGWVEEEVDWLLLRGTPDKVLPSKKLLIDYKTIKEIVSTPKAGWTPQLSCYRWMLHHNGIEIERAIIQQVSMKVPARIEIDLWPLDATEQYIMSRALRFAPVLDGSITLDNLPPMLDPVLDADQVWLCNSSWCPVQYQCKKLKAEGK